jgi:hypothetical protein
MCVGFVKLYDDEVRKLVDAGVSARVWSVYMALRMCCHFPKAGEDWKVHHFMCFPSQANILRRLGKPMPPKKKEGNGVQTSSLVSTSVRKLIGIGMIKVYAGGDKAIEAMSARKLMASVHEDKYHKALKLGRVNVYRMVFWEACQIENGGHVKSSMTHHVKSGMTGHVKSDMSIMSIPTCKEDTLNNIKKNNISINILNEENIFEDWIQEDEEIYDAGEDVREYVKQFESLSDMEILIEVGISSEDVIQALRVLKSRSILEQHVLDLLSRI